MSEAFICDAARTPIGRLDGVLAHVRADDPAAPHVNPSAGAIALGPPLGMSGARLVMTAAHALERAGERRALVTMCVGVGQGVSLALERI